MYALGEAIDLMESRWGHANAPYDADMLEVISLLKVARKKFGDFENKFIETNKELISLLSADVARDLSSVR